MAESTAAASSSTEAESYRALANEFGGADEQNDADSFETIAADEKASPGQRVDTIAAIDDDKLLDEKIPGGLGTPTPEQSQPKVEGEDENERLTRRGEENLNVELAKAQVDTNNAFAEQHPDYAKDEGGRPLDKSLMPEYNDMFRSRSETAHMNAARTTQVQEYTDEHGEPPKDPKEFDEWSKGLQEELDGLKTAKKAVEEVTVVVGGESGESPSDGKDQNKGAESKEKAKEDPSSWMNAFRLASESLTGDKQKKESINAHIKEISDANPDVKPKFETRVKLMKTLIITGVIAGGVALSAAKGATTQASAK